MNDEHWMTMALAQARHGIGKTAPNPPVGAVIVKDEILLGSGWHRKAGMPHAEREAIADAVARSGAQSLVGATAYVTLEPCSTHGRTPPCVQGLIDAGITRVVYACEDPNPKHAGRADILLENHGIAVIKGICREAAEKILRPFAKVQRTGLPWVIVKTAMSLDGRITRPEGESQWLTGESSRRDVQFLRAEVDLIITTGETVRKDMPSLTIRLPELVEGREQPWRLVLSNHPHSLPKDAPLFTDQYAHRTIVRSGDIASLLRDIVRDMGILSVLVEAGGKLASELLEQGLVDEMVCYLAPMITGGLPAVAGDGFSTKNLTEIEWAVIDQDVKFRGLLCAEAAPQ
jgi:diaminohydroxyphosphoribosylaminopyrimidine deaminase / 5-amino-6-(5-phosphoribosylamino)uracil reductase